LRLLQAPQHLLLVTLVSLVAVATGCGGDGGGSESDAVEDTSSEEVSDDVEEDTTTVDDTAVADTDEGATEADTSEADTASDTTEADTEADTGIDTVEVDTTPVCTDGAVGCPCRDAGDACDGGLVCDGDDTCVTAACTDAGCDDDNVCTSDSCDPLVGCSYTDVAGDCDDGDACTVGDTCVEGECAAGGDAKDCDDGFDCTTDSCEAAVGCVHTPDDGACGDDIACTVDTCVVGVGCVNTADDSACDDGNPCTADSCGATKGCKNEGLADYASCSGDAECTGARQCLDVGRAASTCGTLGWNDNYGSSEICSESNVDPNGDDEDCSGLRTFPEAVWICAAAGGRLCTDDELAADETRGTGCSYDLESIWSSTPCDGGFAHRAGSTLYADDAPAGCSAPDETHYVRCCSDIVQLAPDAPLCLLVEPPAETESCTASNPADPCLPTGECDVFGSCVDQPDEGAECPATDPADPCKPTGLCDAAGACVDQVAEGAECPATDPTDPCKSTASCDSTGTCVDTIALGAECPATDPTNSCASEGECDSEGLCQDVALPDGEMCVDGEDATTYDTCFGGACEGCAGDDADPGDDALDGATVVSGDGELIAGVLCSNDVDYYAVDVPQDGALLVNVGEGVGDIWRSCPADIDADVLDPDGSVRESDDDYALDSCPSIGPEEVINNQFNFQDVRNLPAGTYYVRAYGHDATVGADSYTIRIASIAPGPGELGVANSQDDPYDVTGSWYWGRLSDADSEWYRLTVSDDAPSLDITVGYSISWGYRARLYDADGNQLLYVDDSSFNHSDTARIIGPTVNGLAAGDYVLRVTQEGNIHGAPYVVRIQHGDWTTGDEAEPNDTVGEATPIPDGANAMSATLTSGDEDWYSFTVTQKSTLVLSTGIESIDPDTELTVYDATGTEQITSDRDSGVGRTSKLREVFEPGTYTLRVSIDEIGSGQTGDYTLFLVGR